MKKVLVTRFVFIFFFLYIIKSCVDMILTSYVTIGGFEYSSFEISDWMINYEGGFVRRGLIGQLLYELIKVYFCDIRIIIMWIIIVCSFVFIYLVIHIFRLEGFSLLIIPTGCFAGFILFSLFGRRDLLTFLIVFLIFRMYKSLIGFHRIIIYKWLIFYGLSISLILIHESAFFYTFPILFLIGYCNTSKSRPFVKRIIHSIVVFSPILLTMFLVCFFKGNQEIADLIWKSWIPVINAFPDFSQGGKVYGMDALTWKTLDTILLHLRLSYLGINASAFRVVLVIFNWLSIYYLLTRLDVISMKTRKNTAMNHTYMSNIVIIQFLSLLPMFGILSSDWGRILPYWSITSVFIYHIYKTDSIIFPSHLTKISTSLQGYIVKHKKILLSPYFYVFLIMISPFPKFWAPDTNNTIQISLVQYIKKAVVAVSSSLL